MSSAPNRGGDRTTSPLPLLAEVVLRAALAGIYLFAAWGKILDPLDFARAIHNYRLVPDLWIVPLALVLPVWEAVAAIALLAGRLYAGAVATIGFFSLLFAGAVASAVARGLDLACGCFGSGASSRADLAHVALNVAAAIAAGWLLHRGPRRPAVPLWRSLYDAFGRSSAAASRH